MREAERWTILVAAGGVVIGGDPTGYTFTSQDVLPHERLVVVPESRALAAEALVRDLSAHETEPCRFDHHGHCQEHGWFETDPPCPIPRARALVREAERQEDAT